MTHQNNSQLANDRLTEESLKELCERGFAAFIPSDEVEKIEQAFVRHDQTRRVCIALSCADISQMVELCRAIPEEFEGLMANIDDYEKSLQYQQEILQMIRARLLLSQYASLEGSHE